LSSFGRLPLFEPVISLPLPMPSTWCGSHLVRLYLVLQGAPATPFESPSPGDVGSATAADPALKSIDKDGDTPRSEPETNDVSTPNAHVCVAITASISEISASAMMVDGNSAQQISPPLIGALRSTAVSLEKEDPNDLEYMKRLAVDVDATRLGEQEGEKEEGSDRNSGQEDGVAESVGQKESAEAVRAHKLPK
jgi:hypothetical protein